MKNQNTVDGIIKIRALSQPANRPNKNKTVLVDGIFLKAAVKPAAKKAQPAAFSYSTQKQPGLLQFFSQRKLFAFASAFVLLITFAGGMVFALNTDHSQAEGEVLGDFTATGNPAMAMPGLEIASADTAVNNDVLFNTPIENLKNYLATVSEPDIIAKRKEQLQQYLTEKKAPFAKDAETIASQPHWQLILAIAFAESSWGRNCVDNNCSNIGVKPGHPIWRKYDSYKGWIVDFNRLLDKRYKDQTLEQMCGVYVKPCNPNWLSATGQVLDELKERGIE